MSCCDYNCDQERNCPVRTTQTPAKVATARPLYRRCDIDGACKQPNDQCRERCLLAIDHGESLTQMEQVVIWLVTTLAVGLVLVLLGGVVGYLWQVF